MPQRLRELAEDFSDALLLENRGNLKEAIVSWTDFGMAQVSADVVRALGAWDVINP